MGVAEAKAVVEGLANARRLQCEQHDNCTEPVTMLDRKGYIYCTYHGVQRRDVHPCRQLRPHELRRLERGEQVQKY